MKSRSVFGTLLRGLAFGLNIAVIPGLGSLIQGDTIAGVASMLGFFGGAGLLLAGAWDVVRTGGRFWDVSLASLLPGAGLVLAAWLIGAVRPWVYDNSKYEVLRHYFSSRAGAPR